MLVICLLTTLVLGVSVSGNTGFTLEKAELEIQELRENNQELREYIKELILNNQELLKSHLKTNEELKTLRESFGVMVKEFAQLQVHNSNLDDFNRELLREISTIQDQVKNQDEAITELQKQNEALEKNLIHASKEVKPTISKDTSNNRTLRSREGVSKRLVMDVDLEQAVVTLQHEVETLKGSSGSGGIYTRWGRTTCPGNGTELVYEGFAGGSMYSFTGGGGNYVCLSNDPTWDYYVDGNQGAGQMYGAEYEKPPYSSSQFAHFWGTDIYQDDVPCAVCRSQRPSSIMIPGRDICYPGWTKEYSGYLVADHPSQSRTEFVCMDKRPSTILHGKANENGALFYLTEAHCGSLPCPPYIDGRELTCVVCTK